MSKEQEMFALIDEFENSSLNARNFCKIKDMVPQLFITGRKRKPGWNHPEATGL